MRVCSELPMLASRSSTTRAAVLLELEVATPQLSMPWIAVVFATFGLSSLTATCARCG